MDVKIRIRKEREFLTFWSFWASPKRILPYLMS